MSNLLYIAHFWISAEVVRWGERKGMEMGSVGGGGVGGGGRDGEKRRKERQ